MDEEITNIIISFLNHNRDPKHIIKNIKTIMEHKPLSDKRLSFYILTDLDDIEEQLEADGITIKDNLKIIKNKDTKTVAEAKNLIIDRANTDFPSDESTNLLYIFEDDVIINDVECIQLYENLIQFFGLGIVFFGFGGMINTVFDKPNPRLRITGKTGSTIIFNQMPCSALCVINLSINKIKFNPDLHVMEMKEYLAKLDKEDLIPFVGIFIDIDESQKYLHTDQSMESVRIKDQSLIPIESKLIKDSGIEYNIIKSLEPVIEYLNKKNF